MVLSALRSDTIMRGICYIEFNFKQNTNPVDSNGEYTGGGEGG